MLPAAEFESFFNSNFSESGPGGGTGWLGRSIANFVAKSDPSLRKYVGWYHSYTYFFGWPSWVIRSLMHVYERQGRLVIKRIERVKDPIHGERIVYKIYGFVSWGADRLFIVEQDSLQQSGLALKILFRTHRSHVNFLSGLVTGTSMRPDNKPTSARVVLEYLGRTVDAKTEPRNCGMLVPSRHSISPKILSIIDNTFAEGETALHAIAR